MTGITVAFSSLRSRSFAARYKRHILKTIGLKKVEVLYFYNPGIQSLSITYNQVLIRAKNDIVCLIHDDLVFHTHGWGQQLLTYFKQCLEYGLLGLAGGLTLNQKGVFWDEMLGQIYQKQPSGEIRFNAFSGYFPKKILPTLVVDGLFMALCKSRIKTDFDERLPGFHFYDSAFSLRHHLSGGKAGVITDIKVTHLSPGVYEASFETARHHFINLYHSSLPRGLPPVLKVPKHALFKEPKDLKIGVLHFGQTTDYSFPKNAHVFGLSGHLLPHKTGALSELWPEFLKICPADLDLLILFDGQIQCLNACIGRLIQVYLRHRKQMGTLGVRLHLPSGHVFCEGLQVTAHSVEHRGLFRPYGYQGSIQPVSANLAHCMLINPDLLPHCPSQLQDWLPGLELGRVAKEQNKMNSVVGDAVALMNLPQLRDVEQRRFQVWLKAYFKTT